MTGPTDIRLMTAILAMDAYNRGYNQGIYTSPDGLHVGATQIGDATFKLAKPDPNNGFYAASYTWNGKTIISYRGTDNINFDFKFDPKTGIVLPVDQFKGATDVYTGWVSGAGLKGAQVNDAIAAFQQFTTSAAHRKRRRGATLELAFSSGS